MSAAEFTVWESFYSRYGFDVDRLEWVVAAAGAVGARSNGADVSPGDLIPVFEVDKRSKLAELRARLERLGGKDAARAPTKP